MRAGSIFLRPIWTQVRTEVQSWFVEYNEFFLRSLSEEVVKVVNGGGLPSRAGGPRMGWVLAILLLVGLVAYALFEFLK